VGLTGIGRELATAPSQEWWCGTGRAGRVVLEMVQMGHAHGPAPPLTFFTGELHAYPD
jgi:hypothetical protein